MSETELYGIQHDDTDPNQGDSQMGSYADSTKIETFVSQESTTGCEYTLEELDEEDVELNRAKESFIYNFIR